LKIKFSSTESGLVFNYTQNNNTINAQISDSVKKTGNFEGFIIIDDSKTLYRIPVLVHLTKGTLNANQDNGQINLSIDYPEKWSYAKISLIKAGSHDVKTTAITPNNTATLSVHSMGEYWIQADIKIENKTDHAYQILTVNQVSENIDFEDIFHIHLKQVIIISTILIIAVLVSLAVRRK
jgi:minor extracellular serine protease Vpr